MTLIYGVAAVAAVYFYMEYRKKEEAKSSFSNAGGCRDLVSAGVYPGTVRECRRDNRRVRSQYT